MTKEAKLWFLSLLKYYELALFKTIKVMYRLDNSLETRNWG